jgi:hypothetical protein
MLVNDWLGHRMSGCVQVQAVAWQPTVESSVHLQSQLWDEEMSITVSMHMKALFAVTEPSYLPLWFSGQQKLTNYACEQSPAGHLPIPCKRRDLRASSQTPCSNLQHVCRPWS